MRMMIGAALGMGLSLGLGLAGQVQAETASFEAMILAALDAASEPAAAIPGATVDVAAAGDEAGFGVDFEASSQTAMLVAFAMPDQGRSTLPVWTASAKDMTFAPAVVAGPEAGADDCWQSQRPVFIACALAPVMAGFDVGLSAR